MVFAACVVLTACGSGIEGNFKDNAMGMQTYKFQKNGKVMVEGMGMQMEMKYEKDGKDIKIDVPQQPGAKMILKLVDDNTLEGPMGIKFVRQKS